MVFEDKGMSGNHPPNLSNLTDEFASFANLHSEAFLTSLLKADISLAIYLFAFSSSLTLIRTGLRPS